MISQYRSHSPHPRVQLSFRQKLWLTWSSPLTSSCRYSSVVLPPVVQILWTTSVDYLNTRLRDIFVWDMTKTILGHCEHFCLYILFHSFSSFIPTEFLTLFFFTLDLLDCFFTLLSINHTNFSCGVELTNQYVKNRMHFPGHKVACRIMFTRSFSFIAVSSFCSVPSPVILLLLLFLRPVTDSFSRNKCARSFIISINPTHIHFPAVTEMMVHSRIRPPTRICPWSISAADLSVWYTAFTFLFCSRWRFWPRTWSFGPITLIHSMYSIISRFSWATHVFKCTKRLFALFAMFLIAYAIVQSKSPPVSQSPGREQCLSSGLLSKILLSVTPIVGKVNPISVLREPEESRWSLLEQSWPSHASNQYALFLQIPVAQSYNRNFPSVSKWQDVIICLFKVWFFKVCAIHTFPSLWDHRNRLSKAKASKSRCFLLCLAQGSCVQFKVLNATDVIRLFIFLQWVTYSYITIVES